jgi:dihydroneopterin aldolase
VNCHLFLKDLMLPVNLGVSEVERSKPQLVVVNITLLFPEIPHACVSDDLQETICYESLVNALQEFCADKSFYLLEALVYQLYHFLKKYLAQSLQKEVQISLEVAKKPPVRNLATSAVSLSDF